MVIGFIRTTMDTSGVRISITQKLSGLTPQAGTGFTPVTAGPGFRITTGDGLHFTMAAGISTITWAGSGYQGTNGLPPG